MTVQPFSNFAGELAMVQVVFPGAGMTNHMCPKNAAEKIPNLIVSVNKKGCTTGDTLAAAYKELFDSAISKMRKDKSSSEETHIIIADGPCAICNRSVNCNHQGLQCDLGQQVIS